MTRYLITAGLLLLAGCVQVAYDGHKPHRSWYWSREATTQRNLRIKADQIQRTNQMILDNIQQGTKETNGTRQ